MTGQANGRQAGGVTLAFDAVSCVRGGRLVLERLSFAVGAGEALVVTGPNGAGKSTLIRLAAGLLRPSEGRVARAGVASLFAEASALDGERTVAAALGFWAELDELGSDVVGGALAAFDLISLADVPVRLLSTGQRRRAALARVVASGAGLWLLDEPGNGLDAAAVDLLTHAIVRHRASGGAVVIATHQPLDLPDAASLVLA